MTTILVPVDGSAYSVNAVKTALSWANNLKTCTVHILTVLPPLADHVGRYLSVESLEKYYKEETEMAMYNIRPLVEQSMVNCKEVAQTGAIAQTIVDYASKNQIDQIVIGTRGHGTVSGILLGSIATKVLSLSSVPVTLIKEPAAHLLRKPDNSHALHA